MALSAPQVLASSRGGWWYWVAMPGGHTAAGLVFYLGVILLCLSWLILGPRVHGVGTGGLLVVAVLWMLPLLLGPALFSRDVYSYLAQGSVLHHGLNPYHVPPAGLHNGPVLRATSRFWRHDTAPYGPLFLGLMSVVVSATGSHLVAGVLVVRGLGLVGAILLAVYLPRLARSLGGSETRAVWLVLLSPLLALQLVAPAHNDLLMSGLLVAGVSTALRGRPIIGVALCVLAATIKAPALAGALFIAVAWAREEQTPQARVTFLATAALAALIVVVGVSLVTGLGVSWLSSSLFASPARVRLAVTPGTAIGYTLAAVLRALGVAVGARGLEAVCSDVTTALAALAALVLLYRVRIPRLVITLGALLVLVVAAGPATWPWYFIWGMALLAACPGPQRSPALALGTMAAALVIRPDGILALPLGTAPAVLGAYVLVGAVLWFRHRDRDPAAGASGIRTFLASGRPAT
jgi:hypothetical protein